MIKKSLISIILILILLFISVYLFISFHPTFGTSPKGVRLVQVQNSPNFKNGKFQNLEETPILTTNKPTILLFWENLIKPKNDSLIPQKSIPVEKTNLHEIDINKDVIIWLGHSSYYVQINKRRILIDPILSKNASPLPFGNNGFKGTDIYSVDDIPSIDYLLITHNHYDHLDYNTMKDLKNKVSSVLVPLGIGDYFVLWGYDSERVIDLDWYESVESKDSYLSVMFTPARHYSSRTFSRFDSLWGGYIIKTNSKSLFFSGDSGYGKHFKEIGDNFGPFNFVALDSGQYNEQWRYMHMRPEEAIQASLDLNADIFIPSHIGRFALAQHDWREPFNILKKEGIDKNFNILIKKIGSIIDINSPEKSNDDWWNDVD